MSINISGFICASPGYNSAQELSQDQVDWEIKEKFEKYPLLAGMKRLEGRAIYKTEWGCPEEGEKGNEFKGTIDNKDYEQFTQELKSCMAELGQSTVTVIIEQNDQMKSLYFQNKYEENKDRGLDTLTESKTTETILEPNKEKKENAYYFNNTIAGPEMDIDTAGLCHVQYLNDSQSQILVTGIVYRDDDGIHYEGSQNTIFQPDKKAYIEEQGKMRATVNDMMNSVIEQEQERIK